MKKLFISLVILLTFVSCTRVLDETNKYDKDCILLNIYNSPMSTKATNDGTEYERQIKRLDCFFYVKDDLDNCVYYQKVTNNEIVIGGQEIPFFVDESTITKIFPSSSECDVFVIANYPGNDDWSETYETTSVENLKKIVLNLFDQKADGTYKHDAVNKPFVMSGCHIATRGDNNNATGTIPLVRAASKITINLKIPEWLEVTETVGSTEPGNTETQSVQVRYFPVVQDADENIPFETVFHYGVSKTYLNTDYNDELVDGSYPDGDYFSSPVTSYKNLNFTDGATDEEAGYYTCEIEVPFYSYARTWAKGANNAPYLTIKMPWKKTVNDTDYPNYYYQILVNAGGLSLTPNNWYDLTVNVGVLGSLTESLPTEIKSDDITYYILDWTKEPQEDEGDRYEDVVIKEYAYLVVHENNLVINNSTTGSVKFDASHTLGIAMDLRERDVAYLKNKKTEYGAYYVYCGPDANGNTAEPKVVQLPITEDNFSIRDRELVYNYTIPDNVYSPIYSFIKVWLDFDKDGNIDKDEEEFVKYIEIVQYPAIYVIPDLTTRYSVYVNNVSKTGTSSTDNVRYPKSRSPYYGLGLVPGTNSTTGSNPTYMYVVTVSSLKNSDGFYYNADNNMDGVQTFYKYIIGDPRQRTSDTDLNDDGYDMDQNWVTAPAVDGSDRKLQNYYPTSTEPGAFQIIAPKFRIVSFHSNGHRYLNYEGAKMRCASYQEDGFPAGRWRLPTYAEIQFVIKLQEDRVISPIFFSNSNTNYSKYFSATNQVGYTPSGSIFMNFQDASPGTISGSNGSVRCVYDEWYWGSNRDAKKNTAATIEDGEEYLFTWGDKPLQ